MKPKKSGKKPLFVLSLAGLVAALLSVLERDIPWLSNLCAVFGNGCRDTAAFTLFGVSISHLGLVYYCVLVLVSFMPGRLALWIIMLGAGFELTLLYTMVIEKLLCFFCLINLLVITALVAAVLKKGRGWEALSILLFCFTVSFFPFAEENNLAGWHRPPEVPRNIAAHLDGKEITESELEQFMASKLYDARMGLYVLKMEYLNKMINDRLLKKDAEKKGITVDELVDSLVKDSEIVTDEEVREYYNTNSRLWASWRGSSSELLDRIRQYLKAKKAEELLNKHIQKLRKLHDIKIHIKEPPLPSTSVAVGDSPTLGPPNAPVTIVEFSDYLCSACRKAHETSLEIRNKFKGKIRWVFKDYPLEQHRGAKRLAAAARCAEDQDSFWEYQDMLFAAQGRPDDQTLLSIAEELGLDIAQFQQCLDNGTHIGAIEADIRSAREAGVEVTPTFVINGKIRPGTPDPEEFVELIEAELGKRGASQ